MSDLVKQANELLQNIKMSKKTENLNDSEAFNYALKKKEKSKLSKGDKSGPTEEELNKLKDPRSKAPKKKAPKMSKTAGSSSAVKDLMRKLVTLRGR